MPSPCQHPRDDGLYLEEGVFRKNKLINTLHKEAANCIVPMIWEDTILGMGVSVLGLLYEKPGVSGYCPRSSPTKELQ